MLVLFWKLSIRCWHMECRVLKASSPPDSVKYYFMDCIQGHCHNSSQTRLLEGGVNTLLAMLCTLTMRESEIFSSYLSNITLLQYHIWFSTIPDLSLLKNLLNLHIHNTLLITLLFHNSAIYHHLHNNFYYYGESSLSILLALIWTDIYRAGHWQK